MDMNEKKGLICLLIVAMLTLCVPNVAAASTSKLATVTHNGYATDARSQQQTVLAIRLMNDKGNVISTATVNQSVILGGSLCQKILVIPVWIGGATVHIQASLDGNTWTTVGDTTTQTDKYNGFFAMKWMLSKSEVIYFRATYDGDSQYAPAVSNVVKLTVN